MLEDNMNNWNFYGRQNLCVEARKNLLFVFTDDYVPVAHVYDFKYANKRKTYNAIACRTYPRVYLRLVGKTKMMISIISATYENKIVKNVYQSK